MNWRLRILGLALPWLLLALLATGCASVRRKATKQQSLDEWRLLTSPTSAPPRVFVKGDQVKFFFDVDGGWVGFKAQWVRGRIPTSGYRVKSALLRWEQKLKELPEAQSSWREATVIAGGEWGRLATNLIGALTPVTPNHAAYYQAFLADGVCYRDQSGTPHFLARGQEPPDAILEQQFSIEETLQVLARFLDAEFARTHPQDSLFLLMSPSTERFAQPLLVDRLQNRCVLLNPSALYDFSEQGLTASATAHSLIAILPEGHGLALLKNPVSSAARLVDLGLATAARFFRVPLPKPAAAVPPLSEAPGMDLAAWESWLDRYTGTRLEQGWLELRINGEGFFPGLEESISAATNSVHFNIYIFDRDDVAVEVADRLKASSERADVRVVFDRLGSIGGGQVPSASPLPEDFVPPASIGSYLETGSNVKVRKFLNPWFSSNHAKVLLVDEAQGWLGGMNFGREYRYEWHDLMIEIRGPVVGSLEKDFDRAWAHAGPWGDLAYGAALFSSSATRPQLAPEPWMKVRRLPTRTLWKPFSTAVLNGLRHAQSFIYVENPYLLDKRVILGLVHARNRGVDVRVILPQVNDFKAAGRAILVVANYLLEHGVRVYFYPGMTHLKAVAIDGWVCLGSANLNHLSLRVNQEQNIASSDPRFADEVRREVFDKDFQRSHELTQPISIEWMDILADLLFEGI